MMVCLILTHNVIRIYHKSCWRQLSYCGLYVLAVLVFGKKSDAVCGFLAYFFAVFGPPLRPPLYMMMDYFISWLFEGAFHVDEIHMWFKIANIMHALPVLVLWQTDFTPKWVVVLHLHETIARFRTGVKFSLWHSNRGELTQGWLVPGWHFVVVSGKQM